MKKVVLLMIACCFFAAKGFSQEPEKKENPNAPELTFEATVHDFGTIPLNSDAEYEFTFTNTGKEPLIIQVCQGSCTCTAPVCPKEPVKPGEKGTIKVKYRNTHIASSFNQSVTVRSNAKNPSVQISVKGVVSQNPKVETAATTIK